MAAIGTMIIGMTFIPEIVMGNVTKSIIGGNSFVWAWIMEVYDRAVAIDTVMMIFIGGNSFVWAWIMEDYRVAAIGTMIIAIYLRN